MAGQVFANQEKADKAGTKYDVESEIIIKGNTNPYASRGGFKLEKALATFGIDIAGAVAMDIGASTGGFTDCMLQNGAKKVYAVDVGYGQLAWQLRNDPRVVCMERTNIRYLDQAEVLEALEFVTIDVSFISLSKVFPKAYELMGQGSQMVCLIKPQFEAGRGKVGKKGVVRDEKVHIEVIEQVLSAAIKTGFQVKALSFSPIKGPEGNIEFLMWLRKDSNNVSQNEIDLESIKDTVANAQKEL